MAEAVPKDTSQEGYAVTSLKEIQEMRVYLRRAAEIKHLDQETRKTIIDSEAYLTQMEGYTFHIPLGPREFAGAMLQPGIGCFGWLVMFSMLIALAFAPLVLLIVSFSLMTNGSAGSGFFILLLSAGTGYLWYKAMWVPRWKVNVRLRDHRVRYIS